MNNQDKFPENDNLDETHIVEEQKIISLNKFIFLSVISFGMYQIWWVYKAWRFYKQKDKLNINPAVYTIFSIIFLIPLFNKTLNFAKEKGYNNTYSSILLFICYFITNLLVRLPDPFWLISMLSFAFLIPPFMALNFAKRNSPEFTVTQQTSYNVRQIVLIVIGVFFWSLVLFGLIVTD